MSKFRFISAAIILLISVPICSSAQNEQITWPGNQKSLLITTSLSHASYRDFATSPLFYEGQGTNLYLGWQSVNTNRELEMGIDFLVNVTLARAPKSDFFEVNTLGIFSGLEGNVSYLKNLKQLQTEKYDFKLGGTFIGNQNMRINPSLDNSSTGIESIVNLMLSGKVQMDVSRTEESNTEFLFFNFRKRPVKRAVSFQLDAGVLNFNRRPGYNFAYDGPIDGTNTSMFSYVWDKYTWSMNGWRLRTKLGFTQFNTSGNGRRLAYVWDAMHAPGKYAAYQMGMHRIEYTIIINNNR